MFRKFILAALCLTPALIGTADAAELTVQLVNNTPKPIIFVSATLKGSMTVSKANVLTAEIAPSATGTIVIPHSEGDCLFDLRVRFDGGFVASQPEIDLCKTEGMVID